MIRLDSLRTKINLIFFIAFVLMVLIFLFLYKGSESRSLEAIKMQERANMHYLYLYFLKNGEIDKDYLKSQNICIADKKIDSVKFGKIFTGKDGKKRFGVADINFKRYILINNDRFNIILENKNRPKIPYELLLGFIASSLLMLMLYVWMIRSIRPLSELKNKIIDFSEGNLDISCKSNKNDEIAEVANAFDYAAQRIRELIRSRQLLLRAIMHELKTPIGKGRLLSEMVSNSRQKDRFHTIFERLNLLIDEFAKIEQVASKSFKAVFHPFKASDIIDSSVDMLMLDDPTKHLNIVISKDHTIQADFELLSLAIKNLLDNGIKYSTNKQVQVIVRDEQIIISNAGSKLQGSLVDYFTPFHAFKSGLGLGLYIVKSIADIHTMSIDYKYEYGRNVFTLYQSYVPVDRVSDTE